MDEKDNEVPAAVMQSVCLAYLSKEGYECDPGQDVYVDVDETGGIVLNKDRIESPLDRPAVKKVLARLGRYRAVCIYKFDRLGRDQLVIGVVPHHILCQGVKVISPIDGEIDPTSAESKILFGLKGYLSEAERNNIRNRTHDAIRKVRAENKLVGNGVCRYGYQYERLGPGRRAGRRRVIDPATKPIVLRIFQSVAADVGVKELGRQLTLEGIPTPRKGKEWSPWTIQDIIQDPSYKGEPFQADRYKHLGVKVRSPSERSYWARAKGTPKPLGEPTPPIVDEDLWGRANEKLSARKFTRAPRTGFAHWLRHRIICLDCDVNRKMTLQRRGKRWVANCETCHLRVRLDVIDEAAWGLALTAIDNPEILRRSLLERSQGNSMEQAQATINNLERAEKDLLSKVSNLLDLIEDARSPAAREAYESRINDRTAEIEEVRRNPKMVAASLEERRALLKQAEEIVDKVKAEEPHLADTDAETKMRLAGLIGLFAYVGRVEANPRVRMIGASCTPSGLPGKGLGKDGDDEFSVVKFVKAGKGVYPRKK